MDEGYLSSSFSPTVGSVIGRVPLDGTRSSAAASWGLGFCSELRDKAISDGSLYEQATPAIATIASMNSNAR